MFEVALIAQVLLWLVILALFLGSGQATEDRAGSARRALPRISVPPARRGIWILNVAILIVLAIWKQNFYGLTNLETVLTVTIAWFVFREHRSARTVAGMALIVAAAVILGGIGQPYGTMLGALIIGVATEMSAVVTPPGLVISKFAAAISSGTLSLHPNVKKLRAILPCRASRRARIA